MLARFMKSRAFGKFVLAAAVLVAGCAERSFNFRYQHVSPAPAGLVNAVQSGTTTVEDQMTVAKCWFAADFGSSGRAPTIDDQGRLADGNLIINVTSAAPVNISGSNPPGSCRTSSISNVTVFMGSPGQPLVLGGKINVTSATLSVTRDTSGGSVTEVYSTAGAGTFFEARLTNYTNSPRSYAGNFQFIARQTNPPDSSRWLLVTGSFKGD